MKYFKLTATVAIVLLLVTQLDNPVITHLTDKNWLLDYIGQNGISGDMLIMLSAVIFLAIGGPKQLIALIFGYLYHLSTGSLLALGVCVVSAALNYMVAHFLLANILFRRFPKRMNKFNAFASRAPFFKILLLRLFPVGSNVVTNLLSGCVRVPLIPFFLASIIGYLPQIIIFALAGAGIQSPGNKLIYLSIVLAVMSTVLSGFIYRDHVKYRVEQLNMDEIS